MNAAGLAAVAAAVWGGVDYCGGRAARCVSALTVTVASELLGLAPLLLFALLLAGRPTGGDLALGAAAGAAQLAGFVVLFWTLATDRMAAREVDPFSAADEVLGRMGL